MSSSMSSICVVISVNISYRYGDFTQKIGWYKVLFNDCISIGWVRRTRDRKLSSSWLAEHIGCDLVHRLLVVVGLKQMPVAVHRYL